MSTAISICYVPQRHGSMRAMTASLTASGPIVLLSPLIRLHCVRGGEITMTLIVVIHFTSSV